MAGSGIFDPSHEKLQGNILGGIFDPKKNLRTFDNYGDFRFSPDPNFDMGALRLVPYEVSSKSIYSVEGVLTPMECETLIAASDAHYQSLEGEFLPTERQSNRVLTSDPTFAAILMERLRPFILQDPHLKGIYPCGFGTDGTWVPDHINACFRFNQYVAPSIGFTPHRDATYIHNEDIRSIYSILIYLNGSKSDGGDEGRGDEGRGDEGEGFEGGTTSFYKTGVKMEVKTGMKTKVKREAWMRVCDEMAGGFGVRMSYRPKQGSVLIFNHNLIHSGDAVTAGSKYLIRTDLVFRRIERPPDYNYEWQRDPNFIQAVKYFREAMNLELDGDIAAASILYERSLALRQMQKRRPHSLIPAPTDSFQKL